MIGANAAQRFDRAHGLVDAEHRCVLEEGQSRDGIDRHPVHLDREIRRIAAARETARQRLAYGMESRPVQGDELAALQPGLAPRFTHGMLVSRWR